MNAIEKIMGSNDKPKSKALQIQNLADRVLEPLVNVNKFMKDFTAGKLGAIHKAQSIQMKLEEQERNNKIVYLRNYDPLTVIDQALAELQRKINSWAESIKKDPAYYLGWGEVAYQAGAQIKVLTTIRRWLADSSDYDKPEFWPAVEKEIVKQATSARFPSSTSYTSNLLEGRTNEAWAEAARDHLSPIGQVRYWFTLKAEVGFMVFQENADKVEVEEEANE